MRKKLLSVFFTVLCVGMLFLGAVEANAGSASNFGASWGYGTTLEENISFGNPASFAMTNLPVQTQTSIILGAVQTYIMSALLYGF